MKAQTNRVTQNILALINTIYADWSKNIPLIFSNTNIPVLKGKYFTAIAAFAVNSIYSLRHFIKQVYVQDESELYHNPTIHLILKK